MPFRRCVSGRPRVTEIALPGKFGSTGPLRGSSRIVAKAGAGALCPQRVSLAIGDDNLDRVKHETYSSKENIIAGRAALPDSDTKAAAIQYRYEDANRFRDVPGGGGRARAVDRRGGYPLPHRSRLRSALHCGGRPRSP